MLKAYDLYCQEHGQIALQAFCTALMEKLGLGKAFARKDDTAPFKGDKNDVLKLYHYFLEQEE